ncbi:MAG TPA: DnaA/Hda family protein [Longimicrobiales bacterium]|jgi:chromosomal replication initiation ATPase DnaA
MSELDPKFTFDSFVIGPANRLASAAARRAADSPGTSYNPLFIYSASGLGKSHILVAIAHQAARANASLKVLYQALESYLEELTEALEKGHRDAHRDRYRELNLLLLDDVQFLAGQAEAQEMLLGTLDALTSAGSQIVLASDRPPADINGLDARLVSRFSGGLIVDIAAPEYETRVAILRRKTEERGQTLQAGVAEALARFPIRNVRELGGALNRILAIQDLEERAVTPDEIPGLMGAEVEAAPVSAAGGGGGGDDFSTFLDEISEELGAVVELQEDPWRKAVRDLSQASQREGFTIARLQPLLDKTSEPSGWEAVVEGYKTDVARLRAIEAELEELKNPWPEAAQGVMRDPERLQEAEALLGSVRERQRPFQVLGPGPDLAALVQGVPQLAFKAAQQLVVQEKPKYNPLFFWCEDPTGPNALLAACARTYLKANPNARTAVTSVSDFAEDFIRALSAGVAGAWRERWWTVDLLLVHGAQALSETERAQDEFFHLFEALKRRGARVLITADRSPAGIHGIDERLRSRFDGGLVLEVAGAKVGPEAADLTLLDATVVGAPPATQGGPVIPPLDELDMAEGRGGLFMQAEGASGGKGIKEPTPSAASPPGGWFPSGEKVVWHWPRLEDRIVEELE